MSLLSDFSVRGRATLGFTLSVESSNVYFGGQMSVLEAATIFGDLSVNMDVVAGSAVSVLNVFYLASSLLIGQLIRSSRQLTVGDSLSLRGLAKFGSNVLVNYCPAFFLYFDSIGLILSSFIVNELVR